MDNPRTRVLFVEDEPDIADLIRFILGRQGFEVLGASSGEEALHLVESFMPDIILLDLMMPDMDGWNVYQQMKANPDTCHIPVIVVTSKVRSVDKMLALDVAGVQGYIAKPFHPATLISSIHEVLVKDVEQ